MGNGWTPGVRIMITTFTLIDLAGSVALLLLGTQMVQTGMHRAFGAGLRSLLGRSLRGGFRAFLAGTGATAVLQSSTTTCDRNCNVIAPFVSAPGNRNESPLLREALPQVTRIARATGMDLQRTTVSLDGVYDCGANRKAIFNRCIIPNINANPLGRTTPN